MTSVVEPQKQAPTGQTEGKYAEAIEGVVTLPLAEVSGLAGGAGVQGSAGSGDAAVAAPPPHPHVSCSATAAVQLPCPPCRCFAPQVKEKRYGETERGQVSSAAWRGR